MGDDVEPFVAAQFLLQLDVVGVDAVGQDCDIERALFRRGGVEIERAVESVESTRVAREAEVVDLEGHARMTRINLIGAGGGRDGSRIFRVDQEGRRCQHETYQ